VCPVEALPTTRSFCADSENSLIFGLVRSLCASVFLILCSLGTKDAALPLPWVISSPPLQSPVSICRESGCYSPFRLWDFLTWAEPHRPGLPLSPPRTSVNEGYVTVTPFSVRSSVKASPIPRCPISTHIFETPPEFPLNRDSDDETSFDQSFLLSCGLRN